MKIRIRREDDARSELTASRMRMSQAQSELEARKEELRRYEETKDERRDRIYAAILGRTVSADELEMAQEGVSRIDEEGNLKADNILRAEGVLREREKEVEAAREGFVFATKNRMKIDEHRNNWLMAEAKEEDYRQEIELEDFTGKKVLDDRDE
jgi:type III secretion protein O